MKLETQNLEILPLDVSQFSLLLQGMEKLENALGLVNSNEILDENTQIAMEGLYKETLKHEDYVWYTNWQIILRSENESIGSACFIKKIEDNETLEIGYGVNYKYRGKGFATEAIQAMCDYALKQSSIKTIVAETDIKNYASHRVLQKCGMVQYKKNHSSIFWKLGV